MHTRKVLLMICCILMTITLITAGCVTEDTKPIKEKKWLYSDIIGTVTPDTEVKPVDDYHAYVNKEWLSTTQIPEGETSTHAFGEQSAVIRTKFIDLINDPTITGHEADLVRTYYNAYLNWDERNKNGIKPLEKFTKAIENAQTIEEYNKFLSDNEDSIIPFHSIADPFNSSRYTLYIGNPPLSLGDSAEYTNLTSTGKLTKEANSLLFKTMLQRLGYTKEQADKMETDRLDFETQIASVLKTNLEMSNAGTYLKDSVTCSIDELKTAIPNYPVDTVLSGYINNGVNSVLVLEPAGIKKVNELYTSENLDKIKAYTMYMYINAYSPYLDKESNELRDKCTSIKSGMNYTSVTEKNAYDSVLSLLGRPSEKFYVENAVDPKTKEDILSMIHSVIDIYHNRLANATWLTNDTRNKAIEKLDAITIHALYPDDWSDFDYSSLSFEGCSSLADMVNKCVKYEQKKDYLIPGTSVDKNKWSKGHNTLEANAFYSPLENSITILAGITGGSFYNISEPIEKNYAGLGTVIAHEISHAFDSSGSQFDKDGNINNWWTDEDRKAFEEKTRKVADYFSTIETSPQTCVNGNLTVTESVADLGGMSAMLEAASKIENFNYDTFFRNYASMWRCLESEDEYNACLIIDKHPPNFVRTNANVQQFDEFYKTYKVKPGDGMYLLPEMRVGVW